MTEYDSENETVADLIPLQKIKNRPCLSEQKNKWKQSVTVKNASSSPLEDDCAYNSSSSDYKFTNYEQKLLQTSQSSSNIEMSDWLSDSENKTSKLNKTKTSKKLKQAKRINKRGM